MSATVFARARCASRRPLRRSRIPATHAWSRRHICHRHAGISPITIRKELGLERFARPERSLVQELALLANRRVINKLLRRAFAVAVAARGTDDNALRIADLGFEFGQSAGLH